MLKIVSKTYKSIINDNYKHKIYKENTTTCYGSVVPSNIVDSKALVLVIQYGKNIEKKVDDEFVKNIMEKEYFLTELIKQMENEISNILDTKCKVLIKTLSEE